MPKISSLTVLLLASSLLSGCKPTREFPANFVYLTDVQNNVCSEFLIIDKEKFIMQRTRELPLKPAGPCDGLAGFHRDDYPKVRTWVQWELKNQETCK